MLDLNQKNMEDESDRARTAAAASIRLMVLGLLGAVVIATVIALVLSRSILEPIRAVTHAARGMTRRRSRPGRAGADPRRAGRAGRGVQRDGPDASASSARPGPNGCCGPRRPPRRRSTRSPTRWWSSTRPGRSSGPTPRRGGSWAWRPSDGSIPWVAAAAAPSPRWPRSSAAAPTTCPPAWTTPLCFRDDGQERFFLPRVLAIRGDHDGLLGAAVVLTT